MKNPAVHAHAGVSANLLKNWPGGKQGYSPPARPVCVLSRFSETKRESFLQGESNMPEKRLFSLVFSLALFSFFSSCVERKVEPISVVGENYYLPIGEVLNETLPEYNTLYFSSGMGYEIKNSYSNKLIICLEGGPGQSSHRMCMPGAGIHGTHTVDLFLHLKDEYSFFVPEKFDWGKISISERGDYEIDELVENYTQVINEYLSQNNYESVMIAGWSEGGNIAPELYFRLGNINASGLVSIARGGLSRFEQFEIFYQKALALEVPFDFDDLARGNAINIGRRLIARYGEGGRNAGLFPSNYGWFDSTLFRRPFEFYRNIEIPVLFLHGEWDTDVAVESTKYVEENLPGKPFTFVYYPEMRHEPRTYGKFMAMRRDISAWLEAEGL